VEPYIADLASRLAQGRSITTTSVLADGRIVAAVKRPMEGGGWVGTFDDVTERRNSEAKIEHLAHYDAVTGLANRNLFKERIEECLARLRRSGTELAIFLLDFDKFKAVNDVLGHQAGDALLKAVGDRIKASIREVDVVARLGGDEFVVNILPGADALKDGAEKLAARLIDVIGAPYEIEGQRVVIGCSIGIALAPAHGDKRDELLRNADLALYESKKSGRNRFPFYDETLKAEANSRSSLENDLRAAIWREEFELFYQPVVAIETGHIKAVEALVRWRHPTKGLIAPGEFIALAEETGLIVKLGELIITKACHDAMKMPEGIKVAVNVSPVQFSKSNVVDTVLVALIGSHLPPERLELEITEGLLLTKSDENLETLHRLRNLGVAIALDDFGVGYSSLSYLTSFPFDKVKIDKLFIERLDRPETKAVVSLIVQLLRTLTLATVAEGIETKTQLAEIMALGIELGQGNLFHEPAPLADLDLTVIHSRCDAKAA
jgi:diguanylate cyclase (GGDEF)-like protein